MTWKELLANDAEEALAHEMCSSLVDEAVWNWRGKVPEGEVRYFMMKYGSHVAQVARAQALGIDPDRLRMSPGEGDAHMERLAGLWEKAGVPVVVVDEDPAAARCALCGALLTFEDVRRSRRSDRCGKCGKGER